jgi:dolichyl-phosphate beta-glucosyltransferase
MAPDPRPVSPNTSTHPIVDNRACTWYSASVATYFPRRSRTTLRYYLAQEPSPPATCPAPDLSIVIPSFNPGPRFHALLDDVATVFTRENIPIEVLVVDDGTTDGTTNPTARAHLTVLRGPNQGKGAAIRAGLAIATAPLLATLDADGAYSAATLLRLYRVARTRHGAVVGSRKPTRTPRGVASRLFSLYVRLLHGLRFDTQAGVKIFPKDFYNDVAPYLTATGFAFDVDIFSVARRRGWKNPTCVPVTPDPTISSSNVTPRRVVQALADVALLRVTTAGPPRRATTRRKYPRGHTTKHVG